MNGYIMWRVVDIYGILQVRRSKCVQCAVYKEENLKCYIVYGQGASEESEEPV